MLVNVAASQSAVLQAFRRAIAVTLILAVLAIGTLVAMRNNTVVGVTRPQTVLLQVNWGAVVKDGVAIVGAGIAVALAPEITIPILIVGAGGLAAGFDLGWNHCSYGIPFRC